MIAKTAKSNPTLLMRKSCSLNRITENNADSKIIPTLRIGYTKAPSLLKLDSPFTKK